MSRLSYALCTLYTAAFIWNAWCTITTFNRTPLWATVLSAAASVILVIAFVQQLDLAAANRKVARLREQEARRKLASDGPPLNAHEAAAFNRLAASIDLPGTDEPRSAA